MSLLATRTAIIDTINAQVPGLRTCEGHGGRFDLAELKRVSRAAPGVFVAAIGGNASQEYDDGVISQAFTWGAFLVVKDVPATPRDEGVLVYLDALVSVIQGNRWGQDGVEGRPTNIRTQNLYSASLDRAGVALWGVLWQQRMAVGEELDLDTLQDFALYHAEHSLAPGDDEPDAIDNVAIPTE